MGNYKEECMQYVWDGYKILSISDKEGWGGGGLNISALVYILPGNFLHPLPPFLPWTISAPLISENQNQNILIWFLSLFITLP